MNSIFLVSSFPAFCCRNISKANMSIHMVFPTVKWEVGGICAWSLASSSGLGRRHTRKAWDSNQKAELETDLKSQHLSPPPLSPPFALPFPLPPPLPFSSLLPPQLQSGSRFLGNILQISSGPEQTGISIYFLAAPPCLL